VPGPRSQAPVSAILCVAADCGLRCAQAAPLHLPLAGHSCSRAFLSFTPFFNSCNGPAAVTGSRTVPCVRPPPANCFGSGGPPPGQSPRAERATMPNAAAVACCACGAAPAPPNTPTKPRPAVRWCPPQSDPAYAAGCHPMPSCLVPLMSQRSVQNALRYIYTLHLDHTRGQGFRGGGVRGCGVPCGQGNQGPAFSVLQ
jgi:hypothetical protein